MRAIAIKVHNFRSFGDAEFQLSPYTLLVGANNSGKSNVIEAVRTFYESDRVAKYDPARDFPKFDTPDQDSWMEVEFKLTDAEFATLKEEYKLPNKSFRVRKYFLENGKSKAGIYAYEGGSLSDNLFYGAKNVQQDKFGELIYIPAVSRLDEHTKFSGPSALRDLVNFILKKIMDTSASYKKLTQAFDDFEGQIKTEQTPEGHSLKSLEAEITKEISHWGTSFELDINPISPDEVVKGLIDSKIREPGLSKEQDPGLLGQGFQRHLIFALIRLAARYNTHTKLAGRKEFSPQFTWILFEEPEAFLHPSQIDALDSNMRTISNDEGSQVLITTHNPQFVSKNIQHLTALIRLHKDGVRSSPKQIDDSTLTSLFTANQADYQKWKAAGVPISDADWQIDMEAIKFSLWLNPLRCSAFFANKVLLTEGPTEISLFGYLLDKGQLPNPAGGVFFFDSLGKYNLHRFMNLFGSLGIQHAVLFDHDSGDSKDAAIHSTIQSAKNAFTIGIDHFDKDLETFLGIPKVTNNYRKPQQVMWYLHEEKIDKAKLDALIVKLRNLLRI